MDLDFLSKMIGGQGGSNPLAALLPLLLGGKGLDFSSLLGGVGKVFPSAFSEKKENSENTFPPLFGNQESNFSSENGLMNLLGNMISPKKSAPAPSPAPSSAPVTPEYPYELQYNRPFRKDNKEA